MKLIKNISILVFLTILLASCSNQVVEKHKGCPDAIIEWADVLMINGINYQHPIPDQHDENVPLSLKKGRKIGKVTYKMADHACKDHKMKNGDASYLEKGTPIYDVKGYPSTFIVMADDKVYVADRNKKVKTAGEMYPLHGLVKNIHIESTEVGRRLHTLSAPSTNKFIHEWYQLKLEDYDTLYKKKRFEGERVFLEIELNNGVSFRQVYWANTNTFNVGAVGNNDIKETITNELSKIK
ncbi:hypothetical protein [Bacillus sp. EB600]|uniref:hypothetical protein n=1 Tax=Bacillus sp. EB600 TaxID=2806345 RepID=UPI00210DA0EA|nr:hypothetical protein [Bacillus sp. EB600]MCQ6281624.1 hypothetical protein [Bacillus sp. EB600]